jgi:hypothetical protein
VIRKRVELVIQVHPTAVRGSLMRNSSELAVVNPLPMMESAPMRLRSLISLSAVIVVVVVLAGCGGDDDSASTTSTTSGKSVQVETPDGQVSLSLTGDLPPNWPTNFPKPDNATPAGSGSLVNSTAGTLIGVYKTDGSPSDAFDFYKTNTKLDITSSSSAGAGSAFLGTVKLGGSYDGSSVVVAGSGDTTYIVVTLKPGPGGSSTSAGSTTTTT